MGCPGVERDRTIILILALRFQAVMDVLIDFYEDKVRPELKPRVKEAVDFIVRNGESFEPSFKRLNPEISYEPYCHIDAFSKFIEGSIYKAELAEIRRKFLSIIDANVTLRTRKKNAMFCMEFLYSLISHFLHEHRYYVA